MNTEKYQLTPEVRAYVMQELRKEVSKEIEGRMKELQKMFEAYGKRNELEWLGYFIDSQECKAGITGDAVEFVNGWTTAMKLVRNHIRQRKLPTKSDVS